MPSAKPCVFLVVAGRILRGTLSKILKKKGNVNVCGVSTRVPHISSMVAALGANVLILDSTTARHSDFTALPIIISNISNINVVLINMDDDRQIFLECVRTGAIAYLLKEAGAADVLSAVIAAAEGHAVCPPHLAIHLFRSFSERFAAFPSAKIRLELGLTRRQQQLIPLIVQGLTNKEIASRLYISEQTVKNHVHEILRRVGVPDRLHVADLTRPRGSLGSPDMTDKLEAMASETHPDFIIIAMDESNQCPPLCDTQLRDYHDMKMLALAPGRYSSIFSWASFDVHSSPMEASEAGILETLRRKVQYAA